MANETPRTARDRLAEAQVRIAQGACRVQDAIADLPLSDRQVCERAMDHAVEAIAQLRTVELSQR